MIADAERVHGPLFGPLASGLTAGARTPDLVLMCVGVDGVPSIFLEEALWLCAEILADDDVSALSARRLSCWDPGRAMNCSFTRTAEQRPAATGSRSVPACLISPCHA